MQAAIVAVLLVAGFCWWLGRLLSLDLIELMKQALPSRSGPELFQAARGHLGLGTWLAPIAAAWAGAVYLFMRLVHGWSDRRFVTRWAYIIVRWTWQKRMLRPREARRAMTFLFSRESIEADGIDGEPTPVVEMTDEQLTCRRDGCLSFRDPDVEHFGGFCEPCDVELRDTFAKGATHQQPPSKVE